MRKLKDLDDGVNLIGVKLKMTPEIQESYANYSSKGEEEFYIVGEMMGDFFISPDAPSKDKKGSRTLYPMPIEIFPSDLFGCEVISILCSECWNKEEHKDHLCTSCYGNIIC